MKFKFVWEQREFIQILKAKDGIKRGPFGSALKKEYFIPYGNYAVYEQRNAIYSSFNTRYYITQNKFEELKKFELVPGDIIMSGAGTIGRLAMIPSNSKPGVFNQALIRFRVNEQNDNLFFLYFMRTPKLQKKLTNVNPGSAMVNLVPIKEIKKWECLFPYKREQKRIVSLLSKMDSILTLYENKRKLLTALSQGLSQYLFNFSKEKNAIQMSLSSITVSETKGIAKENTLSLGNIEYLDTTRLNGGKAKLVSGKKDVDFRDIIVLWDGSNAGKIYYGFSGILGSTLKVFKLKDDINSEYVFYYLKSKQNLILHKFRTPNIPHVSKDFSQRFNLPIPDKEKQNLIANILHLNELQINLINKKIEKLKQIKESLLQNMFL